VIASKVVKCAFEARAERRDGGAVGERSRGVGWVVSGLSNYKSSGQGGDIFRKERRTFEDFLTLVKYRKDVYEDTDPKISHVFIHRVIMQ
jgi:hypothetical protein